MSISNLKEYARLTMAIKKARAEGKNLDELLTLREKLVNRTIPKKPKKIKIKSREEINRKYYQKHRGWLLDHKKERHEEKREEEEEQRWKKIAAEANQLIKGSNIMILLNFKEYTEVSRHKQELWKDFEWTFRDLVSEGIGNIIEIQKLELLAGNLVRDYYQTARKKSGISTSSWKSLSSEKQERLIDYWWRERVRIKKYAAAKAEDFTEYLPNYLSTQKEVELAKFHEEEGKKNCLCHDCQGRKEIRHQIKKSYDDYWKEKEKPEEREEIRSECGDCGEYKKVSVDSGLCRQCERKSGE